jgi:2-dehydropantoate 2-reductase
MRIAVYGVGGVGGYFGGRLVQAGHEVIFIGRGQHLLAIQANGLQVASIQGDFAVRPHLATADPGEVGPVDVILLAVKAWQVPEVAQTLGPLLASQTFVVPLQNGVDAPAQLAEVIGAQRVLGGLCQISTYIESPGQIRHAGVEPLVIFGEMDGIPSHRVRELRQAFEQAGVKVDTPEDIWAAMWRKFLFIASLSGVGAVSRVPVGVTRSLLETRQMLLQAMQEIADLAGRKAIHLAPDIADATLAFIDRMAWDVVPSMQRDLLEGRPSELQAQSGAVVRMGLESGLATPTHAFIYASLLPQELHARGELPKRK